MIGEVLILLERWGISRDLDALIEAHRLLGRLIERVTGEKSG